MKSIQRMRVIVVIALALILPLMLNGCSALIGRAAYNLLHDFNARTPMSSPSQDPFITDAPDDDQTPEVIESDLQETDSLSEPDETEVIIDETEAVIDETPAIREASPYFDIHSFHGTENLRDKLPVSWQRGTSILQSEVMPLDIDGIIWPVGTKSLSMSTDTDINGDGYDESLFFETEGTDTIRGIFLTQGDNSVNLLNLVSDEFWQTISPIMDKNGMFASGSILQADSLDLDGDGCTEIIIAIGDDNEILAVSVLAYVGGENLYQEVGGFIGRRLLFVTEDHTLYLPYGNSANGRYVEFGYGNNGLSLLGYNMD